MDDSYAARTEAGLSGEWEAAPFLEKVLGIVPSIIYIFNQKTQSNEYSNRSIGELMGFSSEEIRAYGADLMPKLCHPDDLPGMWAYFDSLKDMADGETSQLEYRMRHKSGGWVWLLSYDTIFERDTDGSVLRHLGVAIDITEQKKSEARAIAAKAYADQISEELRAFTYAVTHELRGPVVTLQMLLEEMKSGQSGDLPAEVATMVDQGLGTIDRLQGAVLETLDFAGLTNEPSTKSEVNLNDVMAQILNDFRGDIEAASAKVSVASLPTVTADAKQLRMLFSNLIANGLKYRVPDRPVQVDVTGGVQLDHSVMVKVTDNGIGIDQHHFEKVFKMFWRAHAFEDFPGTGLGLALCRRIALGHGGQISVESTLGEGTSFTVSLPGEAL